MFSDEHYCVHLRMLPSDIIIIKPLSI